MTLSVDAIYHNVRHIRKRGRCKDLVLIRLSSDKAYISRVSGILYNYPNLRLQRPLCFVCTRTLILHDFILIVQKFLYVMPSVPQTGTTESGEHCRLQFVQVGCLVTGFTRHSIKCGQLMTGHVAFTEENKRSLNGMKY